MRKLLLLSVVSCFSLHGRVLGGEDASLRLEDISRGMSVVARSLDAKQTERSSLVMPDGRFRFENLPEGTFMISVINNKFAYVPIILETKSRSWHSYDPMNEGENKTFALDTLLFTPQQRMDFFPPKQPFDIFQSLKSPMFLFTGGVVLLMAVLTRLQSSLGDENDPNLVGRAAEVQHMIEATMLPFELAKKQ